MGNTSHRRRRDSHVFTAGIIVIVLFATAIRFHKIDGFSGEYDEGAHVMVAWLMARGYDLYSEIASAQLPFLYQPTAWVFAIWGPSLVLGRWVEISFALLGIVTVASLGRRLWRSAAIGLWAALFLSLEFYYFYNSRIAVGSVAAAAMGGLAVWCAYGYYQHGQRRWLLLAGAVYSFSLLIKPLSLFVGFLLLVLVIARWQRTIRMIARRGLRLPHVPWRSLIPDGIYLGLGAALLPMLSLFFYDGPQMVNRLIGCRLELKIFSPRSNDYLATLLLDHISHNLALWLLAGIALVMIVRRRDMAGIFMTSWLGLSLVLLLIETGHRHHLVIVDLPLVLLAAYPLGELSRMAALRPWHLNHWSNIPAALGLCLWIGYQIIAWPNYLASSPRGANQYPERWAAVRFLQQVTYPDQFVVSDDMSIPFEAGRLVVPQLADASSGSSGCDLVPEATFMQYTNRSAAAVVFWTDRLFRRQFFAQWVPTAFAGREQIEKERVIYYDKQEPRIAYPLSVRFDDVITLAGYRVEGEAPFRLTLYWRKLQADAHDYKMTLRMVDDQGQVLGQLDRQPFAGVYPTSAWPVEVLLPETIELPEDAARLSHGDGLLLGLYDPQTLNLLTVENGSRSDNLVSLKTLAP